MPLDAGENTALMRHWLRGSELARWERFKVASGRRDFLAGRAAAKVALAAALPNTGPGDWEIATGPRGEPLVRGPVKNVGLTLAHAQGVGVALVFDEANSCGIDVEPTLRNAADAIRTQMSADEIAWAEAGGDETPLRWLLLWTTREALGKAHRTGLLAPEVLLPSTNWKCEGQSWKARFADGGRFLVRAVSAGGFVASVVLPNGHAEAITGDEVVAWLRQTLLDFAGSELR